MQDFDASNAPNTTQFQESLAQEIKSTQEMKWKLLESDISTYVEAVEIVLQFIMGFICMPMDSKKLEEGKQPTTLPQHR